MPIKRRLRDRNEAQALAPLGDVVPRWRANPSHASQRLRLLREAAGLSQMELSARVGITHEQLSKIEDGRWSPLAPTVRKLSQALGVSPKRFVDDSPIRLETLSLPDVG